jgi:phosphatidylglycerol:prolipoprotein diacylglycerol transferase
MIYTFSLLIGFGAAIGLVWVVWRSPRRRAGDFVDAGFAVLFGALLGGRIGYVAVNWSYFQSHGVEIPQVWLGGFSGPGALVGALLALLFVAGLKRMSLGLLADALLPLLASLTVATWLACWLDGCVYGAPVDSWWGVPGKDEWGIISPRLPVQLIGALLTLGVFWLLDRFRSRFKVPGQVASLGLSFLCVQMLGLSFLRADPVPYWNGLRLDTWAWLALTVIALIVVIVSFGIPYLRSREDTGEVP